MATSRKGKGKEVAHKDLRFVSEEAKRLYEIIKPKPIIYERGIDIETTASTLEYVKQIQKLGWTSFCHPRREAVLSWVFEFYANAKAQTNDKVYVRGREVNFSASATNDFFDLDNNVEDQYVKMQTTSSPGDIVAALCYNDSPDRAIRHKHVFKSSTFNREAKVWLLFVNSSLLPTKHSNHVSMERASLIYCILQGARANVGQLIADQLRHKASTEGGRQLWFPTLITELCRHAGVSAKPTDITTSVDHHITQIVMFKNIKVFVVDPDEESQDASTPTSHPSRQGPTGGQESEDEETDNWGPDLAYIKKFQRFQHVHFTARLDALRED